MLRSKSLQGLSVLTLVLPASCAQVLGFEPASLDPEGNRVLATLKADAGDGGADGPSVHSEPDAADAASAHETHDSMDHDAHGVDAGDMPFGQSGELGEHGEQGEDVMHEADAATPDPDVTQTEADAAVGAGTLALDCQSFCDVVMDACPRAETESFAVYDSTFTCLRQCEAYALGTQGDDSGNTLACRMTHALIAREFPGERANSCPAAGPGGNGVCGSNCDGYCNLTLRTCDTFTSDAKCQSACLEVPDLGGFEVSQNEGNSVQCRLYHLGAALASPTFHCPHAAGESPCADALALPLP